MKHLFLRFFTSFKKHLSKCSLCLPFYKKLDVTRTANNLLKQQTLIVTIVESISTQVTPKSNLNHTFHDSAFTCIILFASIVTTDITKKYYSQQSFYSLQWK